MVILNKDNRAYPVAKRIAVAIPIAVLGVFLCKWLEVNSSVTSFMVGCVAYALADGILSTKAEYLARLDTIFAGLRERGLSPRIVATWSFYILLCAYVNGTIVEPTEPVLQQVQSLVHAFGFITLFILEGVTAIARTFTRGLWFQPKLGEVLFRLLKGLTILSVALWLIGAHGDALYRWTLANHDQAAIYAVSFVMLRMVVQVSRVRSSSGYSGTGGEGEADSVTRRPTKRENRYTAAHEAGHALVYAALGGLPSDMKVVVNDHSDEYGVLGFVTGISSKHHLNEKSFAEWHMLVFLAGKLGESAMHGESTLGSSNDHMRWLGLARSYLANHFRGMYYQDPKNKFEQESNEAKLEELQGEQVAMLRILFELNENVLVQLAETLLDKRTMNREDLTPFIARVKLPDSFLPFGPFETFGIKFPLELEES